MKTIPALLAALALLAGPAVTAEEGGKPDGEGHRKHEQREDILKKFDADGDGKLNEAERTTARAALTEKMKKDHPEAFARADKDGDGSLSEEEFQAGREKMREHRDNLKERADTNGDGTVDDAEKAAAKARFEEMKKKADTNGDGVIDDAEREAAKAAHRAKHGDGEKRKEKRAKD